MKRHRFIGDFNFQSSEFELIEHYIVHQIKNVLRLGVGEEIILGDGQSREAVATITQIGSDSVSVLVKELAENYNEPSRDVSVYCAILKNENFEWVVQKITEVGAIEIIPVITRRTIKTELKVERLNKIIHEAAEQSGRGRVPLLRDSLTLLQALERAKVEHPLNFFFDPKGSSYKKHLSRLGTDPIGIFIGPEGGWDDSEITEAKEAGFKLISLGPLTVRAETAALLASFAVISAI